MNSGLGTLTIQAIGAEVADNVLTANSAPKLFCKIKLGTEIQQSSQASRNRRTFVWSQEFKFRRTNEMEIQIGLYHKNFFISPDLLGEGKLRLTQAFERQEIEIACFLLYEDTEVGKIDLKVKWEPDIVNSTSGQALQAVEALSSSSDIRQNSTQDQSVQASVFEDFEEIYQEEGLIENILKEEGPMGFQFLSRNLEQRLVRRRDQRALEKLLNEIKEAKNLGEGKCIVCYDTKTLGVFYKCGHICCCSSCAPRFVRDRCPVCRQRVLDFIQIYHV